MTSDKKRDGVRENPVTYEIYASLPDDGNRYEVADGVLELMSPGPSVPHQLISGEVQQLLNKSCKEHFLIISAPVDVILSDTEVRQPDLVMIHRSRTIVQHHGIVGSPDLIVEILSPYSRKRDKVHKMKAYARYGVPEYWVIDPASQTLEQFVLHDKTYELADLYAEDEPIRSSKATCANFTMNDIFSQIPELPEH